MSPNPCTFCRLLVSTTLALCPSNCAVSKEAGTINFIACNLAWLGLELQNEFVWKYISITVITLKLLGVVMVWSYNSWIYNYLCNQYLSPQTLWVRILLRWGIFDTTLCDKVYQWLATGTWFSPGTPVSSTNKTDHQDITEIMLKVVLNTINQTNFKIVWVNWCRVQHKIFSLAAVD